MNKNINVKTLNHTSFDSAEPWTLFFQDNATPQMEALDTAIIFYFILYAAISILSFLYFVINFWIFYKFKELIKHKSLLEAPKLSLSSRIRHIFSLASLKFLAVLALYQYTMVLIFVFYNPIVFIPDLNLSFILYNVFSAISLNIIICCYFKRKIFCLDTILDIIFYAYILISFKHIIIYLIPIFYLLFFTNRKHTVLIGSNNKQQEKIVVNKTQNNNKGFLENFLKLKKVQQPYDSLHTTTNLPPVVAVPIKRYIFLSYGTRFHYTNEMFKSRILKESISHIMNKPASHNNSLQNM